jgi:LPXTG-motif cell wall-anchored protein
VVGNLGTGISVTGGSALLRGNLVAGSGGDGISVSASATAEVRRTRIWESAQEPIAAPGAPAAPTIEAAIRSGSGETLRRTLVLTELPEGDAGRIEVFANASCDDPEAELLLSIERTKGADETARIVQVPEAPDRDHFTVTYTSAAGRTSEVSNCASGDTYPDADGDGSVDPLDEVLGAADDATSAIIPTDTEQLLLLKVAPYDPDTDEGGGSLESVSIGEDPAPDSHPAGWGLPYGALSFRISGLEPGGRTTLVMAAISGTEAIAGTSYWKYGPEVPGGASSWYDFAYDEATETGAVLTSADVAGAIRKAFALRFADGARGDSDGGANGSITDPGGPVFFEGDVSPTTTTTTTTSSPSTSTPAGPTTTVDAPTTTASGAPGGGAGPDGGAGPVDDGTLPRTGTDAGWPLALGAALVLLGGVALGARRARLAR